MYYFAYYLTSLLPPLRLIRFSFTANNMKNMNLDNKKKRKNKDFVSVSMGNSAQTVCTEERKTTLWERNCVKFMINCQKKEFFFWFFIMKIKRKNYKFQSTFSNFFLHISVGSPCCIASSWEGVVGRNRTAALEPYNMPAHKLSS